MKKILLISLVLLLSFVSLNAFNTEAAINIDTITLAPSSVDPNPTTSPTLKVKVTNDDPVNDVVVSFTITITPATTAITIPSIAQITVPKAVGVLNGEKETTPVTLTINSLNEGNYNIGIMAKQITPAGNSVTDSKTLTINPKAKYSLSGLASDNKLKITSQPSKSRTKTFKISNTGSIPLTFTPTIPTFEDDGTSFVPSLTGLSTINPGITDEDIIFGISVPSGMDIGTYSEDLILTYADENSLQQTIKIPLEVNVDPKICKVGRVKEGILINDESEGNLRIDINDPDDSDNFKPGDKISIDVNIDNDANDDKDVIVEARLYNIDRNSEIASVESDSENIDEGDDKDFNLELKVPVDDSDLKDSDTYILFVKAYEDGDEDQNCNYDGIDMDFERQSNDVTINQVTITPSVATCSDTINFAVDVQNIGKKDQDNVKVTLDESVLGLDLSSEIFSLKKFDKSGDNALKSFLFKIPDNAKEGDYYPEAKVYFSSDSNSKKENKLTIKKCQAAQTTETVKLTLAQSSFTVSQGNVFTVPLTIKNLGTNAQLYKVDVELKDSWADVSSEQSVNVAGSGETTLYVYLTPKPSLTSGTYNAGIVVKAQDGKVLKTESITATIPSTTPTGNTIFQPNVTLDSIWRNLSNSTAFWIVAIIIVFGLVIFALSALVRPR